MRQTERLGIPTFYPTSREHSTISMDEKRLLKKPMAIKPTIFWRYNVTKDKWKVILLKERDASLIPAE